MTTPVVVVIGASADARPPGIEPAEDIADVRYAPDAAALREGIAEADALFFWRAKRAWVQDSFDDAARLRWIQSASDGVDGLLFPALVASDVVVTNARGVFDDPIAEWVIAAIAAFSTGLHRSVRDQGAGVWVDGRQRARVAGQRLAVVGPGPIGRATARRARALGLSVEGVGRTPRSDPDLGDVAGPDGLRDVLARADHVLDALPLTEATRSMFDADAFAAMPATAHFYNVGRGGTVDEAALTAALHDGTIAGAALDVFAEEPLPADSPLWTLPNVIVSPHVCGDVEGWEQEVVALFVDNVRRFAAGEPLRNLVDTGAGFGVG